MKRIPVLFLALLFIVPFHAGAGEPSPEDQRIAGIDRALKATVKIQPNSTNIAGLRFKRERLFCCQKPRYIELACGQQIC